MMTGELKLFLICVTLITLSVTFIIGILIFVLWPLRMGLAIILLVLLTALVASVCGRLLRRPAPVYTESVKQPHGAYYQEYEQY